MQPKALLLTLIVLAVLGGGIYWGVVSGQYIVRDWFEEDKIAFELYSDEAYNIARASVCSKEGVVLDAFDINENSMTWWFDMTADKPGCSPACVVDDATKKAEINWRCTGLTQ